MQQLLERLAFLTLVYLFIYFIGHLLIPNKTEGTKFLK